MKELLETFKTLYRDDRGVLVMMIGLVLVGSVLFVLPLVSLNPAVPRIWARYTDVSSGYAEGSWWYLVSFSVLALVLTVGHSLIAARLYEKKGAGVAKMFLTVSIVVVLVAISYLLKIVGMG